MSIQDVLAQECVLNVPVTEYIPQRLGSKVQLGAAGAFKDYVKHCYVNEPGKVIVGNTVITTEPVVSAVLRALLYTGCCRIEARSDACRELFLYICGRGKHLGVAELLSVTTVQSDNPFVAVLQKAIQETVDEYAD